MRLRRLYTLEILAVGLEHRCYVYLYANLSQELFGIHHSPFLSRGLRIYFFSVTYCFWQCANTIVISMPGYIRIKMNFAKLKNVKKKRKILFTSFLKASSLNQLAFCFVRDLLVCIIYLIPWLLTFHNSQFVSSADVSWIIYLKMDLVSSVYYFDCCERLIQVHICLRYCSERLFSAPSARWSYCASVKCRFVYAAIQKSKRCVCWPDEKIMIF